MRRFTGVIGFAAVLSVANALACPAAFAAGIYKTVNADGSVTFTDRPTPGKKSTPVNVNGGNNYTPERTPYAGTPAEPAPDTSAGGSYASVTILAPSANATFHSNDGTVPIRFVVKPPLRNGDTVHVLVDGAVSSLKSDEHGISQLSNLERGTHSVVVQVLDSKNKPLVTSDSVTFYVQKASVLLGPQAKPPDSPSRRPGGAVMTPPKKP